jgi:acetylornithine deacetylase/succinyl-diaminopimelate desuccinylase-like protein
VHDPTPALAHQAAHAAEYLDDLRALVRIPSVSAPAFPAREVRRSAHATAALLERRGLERVELLELPGVHPYVHAELVHDPALPTVLLYAHHDVQPPGDPDGWRSPPFEPALRGGRLYGRGSADDKAGIVVHAAAVESWLRGAGALPVNVRVLVEGEEETDSTHLPELLRAYRHRLSADAVVVADAGNLATGWPSLTTSVRGHVALAVEVRALERPLHSGLGGGPVPDAALALATMLASLVARDGTILVPGLLERVRPPGPAELAALARLPVTRELFARHAGLLDGVELVGTRHPLEASWYGPSLTVDALEAGGGGAAADAIQPRASARLGVRLIPDMEPGEVAGLVAAALRRAAPWGVQVSVDALAAASPWRADTTHPAFPAALRALSRGYEREAVAVGCGASIGVVAPLVRELGGIPALVVGVEDPGSRAHAQDESVDVAELGRATRAAIHLLAELGEVLRR